MKFQLPSLKLLLKMIVTLAILIACGLGLLILVYTIPLNNISKNVAKSAETFSHEGYYTQLDNPNSILDTFTDALMLMEAAYDGDESAFQKAMMVPYYAVADVDSDHPEDHLTGRYIHHTDSELYKVPYARYWHGFLIFLKPMLCLFTYSQLNTLNFYLQIALSLMIIILMIIKKCWQAIPAYAVSVLLIHPLATAFCLQYSTIFYIFTVFSILLLLFQKKLSESKDAIYLFFLTLGAVTSYLDFLTYPIATFCMVAVLYICLERGIKNHIDIRNIINLLVCWGIGYAVMFASKWLIASVFTDADVIQEALDALKFRTGSVVGSGTVSRSDVIIRNLSTYFYPPNLYIALALLIIEIIILIFSRSRFRFDMTWSLLLVTALPFVWYCCASNHSYIHTFFAYKSLVGAMYAFLCIFISWDLFSESENAVRKKMKR